MSRVLRALQETLILLLMLGAGYVLLAYPGQILFAFVFVGVVIVLIDGVGALVAYVRRKIRRG